MANTSEFRHSMLVPLSPWDIDPCIEEKTFGIIFVYFTMALCFLLGSAANSWCLWFYLSVGWKNRQPQVFLLNHIIMELILCIECAIEILDVFAFNDYHLFLMSCFLFGLSSSGRPLMQTCICIEQYIAVIHPVTFLRYRGVKYRSAVAATAWLMAFASGFYYTSDLYYYYFFAFVFFMSVTVIFFCCVSVLLALKHPTPGDTHIAKQASRDMGNQQKKQAFSTILSVLLIILFTYLPQVLLFFVTVINDCMLFNCNIVPIVSSINIFGVMIAPFIIMYREGQLKCVHFLKKIKVAK